MIYDRYEIAQGWSDKEFGNYTDEQAELFQAQINTVSFNFSVAPLRVLDIGFGNGAFMGWVRSRGWICEGLEVNTRLIDRATQHDYVVSDELEHLLARPDWQVYDLITAFDVLEHIERAALVPFLISLRSACGPNTLLMFRFPNGDSPFVGPLQNGDVTHLTTIGSSMLRQVAEIADYDVVLLDSPPVPLRGTTLKRRIAIIVGTPVRWLLGQFIRHIFMGGLEVAFTGNLFAVLKPRKA